MNTTEKPENLAIQGSHVLELSRERLWRCLNDPEILRLSIKGCDEVRKINDSEFDARFRFRIGPVKKNFSAILTVQDARPPQSYKLSSTLDGGIAGKAVGVAHVELEKLGSERSELHYTAKIYVHGVLAEFGTKLLEKTAHRYMEKFFQKMFEEIERSEKAEDV